MLDLKLLRESPDRVRQGVRTKGESDERVTEAIALDEERRRIIGTVEGMKSRKNTVSAQVAKMKAQGEDASSQIAEMRTVADEIKGLDERLRAVEERLSSAMLAIPNLPHESVPQGTSPADNQVLAQWGETPAADAPPRPHWEMLEKHGLIDFARGTKITGAGFPLYVGKGAKLERALINFFLDEASEAGYTEIFPPLMVNQESARGTGQLPDKEDQMYVATKDDLYLVPTAEVPLTNIHRDEILPEERLPVKYCAYTPCFRREAGSYGKDVRGLNRVHQFNKVELVKLVLPGTSYEELELLRADAERVLRKLALRYHVLLMCSADLGFTQTKKYDLEVWSPGQEKWLEVSSISNFESFQARRLNLRYRPKAGGKPEILHTLNASALALPRIVAAILEQCQTPEGKVILPKVLHRYTGFETIG
jgi:seryl-tRNA synthetase